MKVKCNGCSSVMKETDFTQNDGCCPECGSTQYIHLSDPVIPLSAMEDTERFEYKRDYRQSN